MAQTMYEAKPYSFDLNEEMLGLIAQEFDPAKVVDKMAKAVAGSKKDAEIEAAGKKVFEDWGRNWMKRSLQLGEEYSDRTYEVLKESADHTGSYRFPLIPQRFIELAYLASFNLFTLPIVENSPKRFVYKVVDCPIYKGLTEKLGAKVANLMTCRHNCLSACKTAFEGHNVPVVVEMPNAMAKDNFCQFMARPA